MIGAVHLTAPITSCARGHHNMPLPLPVDLQPIELESGVQVTCDVTSFVPIFLGLSC